MTSSLRAGRRARALVASVVFLVPVAVFAHAVVYPKSSAPRAYEKYVLRVPNEKLVATTKVEMTFPAEVRVISFSDIPGWTVEAVMDSAQRIVGAVWTGTLAPHRFVELPFIAVNPESETRLVWPAYQTYADGERVAWTGPEESQSPASVTIVGVSAAVSGGQGSPEISGAMWIAIAALVTGLTSLGFALRSRNA